MTKYTCRFNGYDEETGWVIIDLLDRVPSKRLIDSKAFFPDIDDLEERANAIRSAAALALASTVDVEYGGPADFEFWTKEKGTQAAFVTEDYLNTHKFRI